MKKFLAVAALALAGTAGSQQTASAWVNAQFGIGLNMGFQSGGNCWLWGAFRNGQPPEDHHHPHHEPFFIDHGPDPYFMDHGMNFQTMPDAPAVAMPARTAVPNRPAPNANHARWGNPAFQTVNFAPNYYGYQGGYVPEYDYSR